MTYFLSFTQSKILSAESTNAPLRFGGTEIVYFKTSFCNLFILHPIKYYFIHIVSVVSQPGDKRSSSSLKTVLRCSRTNRTLRSDARLCLESKHLSPG